MSLDDYEPGAAHPDPEPAPTAPIVCFCGFDGDAPIHQTAPCVPASMAGPEEPPTFEATCPECGQGQDVPDDDDGGDMVRYPKQAGQDADAHRRVAMENLRLLDEVKRLEATNQDWQKSLTGCTDSCRRLEAKVEEQRQLLERACELGERACDLGDRACDACDRKFAEGMDAAARLFNDLGDGFLDRNAIQNMILAAKEQAGG